MMRKQEYEKAREQSSKVESDMLDKSNSSSVLSKMDKRKKLEEDAMHKVGREITQSPKGLLDLRDDFQLNDITYCAWYKKELINEALFHVGKWTRKHELGCLNDLGKIANVFK